MLVVPAVEVAISKRVVARFALGLRASTRHEGTRRWLTIGCRSRHRQVTGVVPLDGAPPNRLPADITGHLLFLRTFGDVNFEVGDARLTRLADNAPATVGYSATLLRGCGSGFAASKLRLRRSRSESLPARRNPAHSSPSSRMPPTSQIFRTHEGLLQTACLTKGHHYDFMLAPGGALQITEHTNGGLELLDPGADGA